MNANIFINGLNAKTGGGKSILNNYLSLLKSNSSNFNFFVLVPNKEDYVKYESELIKFVDIRNIYKNTFGYPFVYSRVIPNILQQLKINVVFNLADIPIKTNIKQVFLFDWSYAVYPDSIVWKMMDFQNKVSRKIKLLYFKRFLKYVDLLIAQTSTMAERITNLYGFKNIIIIPNAVSLENLSDEMLKKFELPSGIKLLYLTHYYPHKNLEIFIPLAQEIKKRGLDYKLITTIDCNQGIGAKKFLQTIDQLALGDIIHNIGSVEMQFVPSLYKQCNGLLMPTLLESFSGTYVEAMYHRIPIFTSDIDFASGVCKNGAIYFDPFDVNSILNKLELVYKNKNIRTELVENASKVLKSLHDWEQTFEMYNNSIRQILEK